VLGEEQGSSLDQKLARVRQFQGAGIDAQVYLPLLLQAVRQGVREGFQGSTVQAVMNPTLLQHAAAAAATGGRTERP
jgi:hypothetical protein